MVRLLVPFPAKLFADFVSDALQLRGRGFDTYHLFKSHLGLRIRFERPCEKDGLFYKKRAVGATVESQFNTQREKKLGGKPSTNRRVPREELLREESSDAFPPF